MAATHILKLLTADGDVVQEVELQTGQSLAMGFPTQCIQRITTQPVGQVDEFVLEHLDEIIGIAAAALWWRDEAKRPKDLSGSPREAMRETARSAVRYVKYGTIIDTTDPALRAWLLPKVPATLIKMMEGG